MQLGVKMKKYLSLLKYEFKTLVKDPINLFLLVYPFLILSISGFLIPAITNKIDNSNNVAVTLMIMLAVSLSVGSFITGGLLGFSLIENKDENTILNISVTPISIKGYTIFKIIYTYIFAMIGNIIIIGGLKVIASQQYVIELNGQVINLLDNILWLQVITFSIVSSLLVPTVALIISSFSKNKIEGFAFIKGGAIVIMIPVLSLLSTFSDTKQYILGIVPNFWAVKGLLNSALASQESSNLNYYIYLLFGVIYSLLISIISYKIFTKRLHKGAL